jgi:ABC-type bacteriocin/lantibiotic exporter with double-glycine peptidase domain
MPNVLPVPHRLQLADGYCLPACVQMVLAYWDIHRDQAEVAKQLKTVPGVGTPASNLLRLRSRRLEVTFGSGNTSDLRAALLQGIPPIAMVKTQMLPYWDIDTAHAVVLLAMDDLSVTVHDRAKSQAAIQFNLGYFELAWEEIVHYFGVIRRK